MIDFQVWPQKIQGLRDVEVAFYSDNPSLNPTEAYSFFANVMFEKNRLNLKEAGVYQCFSTQVLCSNLNIFTSKYFLRSSDGDDAADDK